MKIKMKKLYPILTLLLVTGVLVAAYFAGDNLQGKFSSENVFYTTMSAEDLAAGAEEQTALAKSYMGEAKEAETSAKTATSGKNALLLTKAQGNASAAATNAESAANKVEAMADELAERAEEVQTVMQAFEEKADKLAEDENEARDAYDDANDDIEEFFDDLLDVESASEERDAGTAGGYIWYVRQFLIIGGYYQLGGSYQGGVDGYVIDSERVESCWGDSSVEDPYKCIYDETEAIMAAAEDDYDIAVCVSEENPLDLHVSYSGCLLTESYEKIEDMINEYTVLFKKHKTAKTEWQASDDPYEDFINSKDYANAETKYTTTVTFNFDAQMNLISAQEYAQDAKTASDEAAAYKIKK